MRAILLITAAAASGWLVACSKPAAESGPAARDIRLAAPPAASAPLVSKLEAGQSQLGVEVQHSNRKLAAPAAHAVAQQAPAPQPQAGSAAARVLPVLSQSSIGLAEAPDHLPMAAMPMAAAAEGSGGSASVIDEAYHPSFTPHNPGIIIRGGMGGIDDKCDLRPRGLRGGIAINRSTPPLFRGGIR